MDAAVETSHETAGDVRITSGVAVAAVLAAVIDLLVLGLVNVISAIDAGSGSRSPRARGSVRTAGKRPSHSARGLGDGSSSRSRSRSAS